MRLTANLRDWYPLVKGVVPTPKTVIIESENLAPLAYGPDEGAPNVEAEFDRVVVAIRAAAAEVGGYPLFLRTGYLSGKHSWLDTCYVPDADAVPQHVYNLAEESELAGMFSEMPSDTWVVRELLPTFGLFMAFHGMPVTRERRYFVSDGKVIGHHPYWPPDALDGYASVANWRDLMPLVNDETLEEITGLTRMTERVGAVVPGAWSVDWLWVHRPFEDASGWYLTDMAPAEQSFVWREYPTAPQGIGVG